SRVARSFDLRGRVLHAAPVLRTRGLVVRQLHAHVRTPAYLEILLDGLDEAVALVSDMAGVKASFLLDDGAQSRELIGRAVGARRVDESGREPDRALVHRPSEQGAHRRELVATGSAGGATHHALPQRAVAYERTAGDGHIGAHARRAGPVDDDAAANEEVGHPLRSRPAPRSRRRATTSSFGEAPPAGDPS